MWSLYNQLSFCLQPRTRPFVAFRLQACKMNMLNMPFPMGNMGVSAYFLSGSSVLIPKKKNTLCYTHTWLLTKDQRDWFKIWNSHDNLHQAGRAALLQHESDLAQSNCLSNWWCLKGVFSLFLDRAACHHARQITLTDRLEQRRRKWQRKRKKWEQGVG